MRTASALLSITGLLTLVPVAAAAGTLKTTDDKSYSGAVLSMNPGSVTFLWQKQKDQPDRIRAGDAEEIFRAQGQKAVAWDVPLDKVESIDGLPIREYQALYAYNGFYRTFEELSSSRLMVTAKGGFLEQIKSVVVFLALILVLTPLALMLVAIPAGSERLGFLGAIGIVLLLSIMGLGVALVSKVAIGLGPFMASAGVQVGLTLVFVAALGLMINFTTRFTLWQGMAFAATWGACLVAIGRITARIVGVDLQ